MTNPIYTSEKVCSYVYHGIHKITGQFYSGSRTTHYQILPSHLDLPKYQTSSRKVKELGFDNFDWIIVAEFFAVSAKDDAYWFEQDLIKENWKNPLKLNGRYQDNNAGKPKFSNGGKTKETDKSIAARAEKIKGRTKETDKGIASAAEKLTGRTKEDFQYLQVISNKRKGLTKDNSEWVSKMAETQKRNTHVITALADKRRGKTKDTCPSVAKISETLKGRTKENHLGVAKMAETLKKLNPEQRALLVKMRQMGMTVKMIHSYFCKVCEIPISTSVIYRTLKAAKSQLRAASTLAL